MGNGVEGSYGRNTLAVKQRGINKTTQSEREIEETSGERDCQIDKLARNLDTVRNNLVPGQTLG